METAATEIVRLTVALFGGSLLIAGGIAKIADFRGAWVGVLDYRVVPSALAKPTAGIIAAAELTLGVGVVLSMPVAISVSVFFLALITCVATSALIRGLSIDCHCGPDAEALSIQTLGRNALVMVGLVALLLGASEADPLASGLLDAGLAAALSAGLAAVAALLVFSTRLVMPRARVNAMRGATR